MPYKFKLKPYSHQLKIWEESREAKVWALFMEMGCVDSETEYLSPLGWKKISEYSGGEVAQFYLDGTADFVLPTAYLKKPCAEFYHFKHTRGLDQVLSPGHRILALTHETYFKKNKVSGSYKPKHHWIELTPERAVQFNRKYANIQIETTFHLKDGAPGLGLTEAQLRVQVAFHADGCLSKRMRVRTQDYIGVIRIKRERKKIRLEKLLIEANIPYRRNNYVEGFSAGYSVFTFVPPIYSKTYANFWGKVSYDDRKIIADECQHWDGSQTKAGSFTFGSVDSGDLDFIQYCLVSTGRRASMAKYGVHAIGSGRSTNVVQLHCRPEIGPSGDGNMYCFSVPSSYLVFRRNGCVFVSGNTGKSAILINTFGYLFEEEKIDAVVYIAKKGEYGNFARYEIPAHLPDRIGREVLVYSAYTAKTKTYQQQLKSLLKPNKDRLPIFVVNVEGLIHGASSQLDLFYDNYKKVFFVLDESTCAKHYDSQRSKRVYYWASKSLYRRIATGTPVTQAPADLFGQSLVLGKSTLGFTSFYAFRNTYCKLEMQYLGNRSFQKVVGYKNLEDLTKRVSSFSHRILKTDCLDLPPKVYTQRIIPLTEKQAKLYAELRDEAMLTLEGHELEVINVLSQITKLQQIVCGQLKVGEDEYVSIENNRLDALVELLEDYPGKAVIWAAFRQSLADIVSTLQEKFGKKSTVGYYGGVSDADRKENVNRFKGWRPVMENGQMIGREEITVEDQARFIVANQAMGFGNTWTEAELVIYYANSYNLEHRLQSEDRTHRIGQTKTVVYVDMFTPDTVEERVVEVLRAKKSLADEIMARPKTAWL